MRTILFLLALLAAPSPSLAQNPAPTENPAEDRARAFMETYASDILAGERTAIAGRYSRRGPWMVVPGFRGRRTHEEMAAFYAGPQWSPPAAFAWHDLAYEARPDGTVLVSGAFAWEGKRATYVALLIPEDGELRIRFEQELPEH